jgi:hypothetical protein
MQDIVNDDGTVTRWKDGVATTYATQQEAMMAAQPTAMDSFGTKYEALRSTAVLLFDQIHAMQRFLQANPKIATDAQAASAGVLIGDSLMSKEQVQTALLLFTNASTFAAAEIAPAAGFSNESAVLRMV